MSKLKNNIYTTDVYLVQDWLFWPGWNTDHVTIEGRDAHSDSKCTQSPMVCTLGRDQPGLLKQSPCSIEGWRRQPYPQKNPNQEGVSKQ